MFNLHLMPTVFALIFIIKSKNSSLSQAFSMLQVGLGLGQHERHAHNRTEPVHVTQIHSYATRRLACCSLVLQSHYSLSYMLYNHLYQLLCLPNPQHFARRGKRRNIRAVIKINLRFINAPVLRQHMCTHTPPA